MLDLFEFKFFFLFSPYFSAVGLSSVMLIITLKCQMKIGKVNAELLMLEKKKNFDSETLWRAA
jgi:hypothetical protein